MKYQFKKTETRIMDGRPEITDHSHIHYDNVKPSLSAPLEYCREGSTQAEVSLALSD